jgi:hypothetical protein
MAADWADQGRQAGSRAASAVVTANDSHRRYQRFTTAPRSLPQNVSLSYQGVVVDVVLGFVRLDWTSQLDWHGDNHLRPKLIGLTDVEYL